MHIESFMFKIFWDIKYDQKMLISIIDDVVIWKLWLSELALTEIMLYNFSLVRVENTLFTFNDS